MVSWKSFKQTCINRFIMESEFIALNKAREEAEWFRQFLKDIPLWPKPVPAICFHYDNQGVISMHKTLYITVSLDIFVVDIIL